MSKITKQLSLEVNGELIIALLGELAKDQRVDTVLSAMTPEARELVTSVNASTLWVPSSTLQAITEATVACYGFAYLRDALRRSARHRMSHFARETIQHLVRLFGPRPETVLRRINQFASQNTRGTTWEIIVLIPGRAVLRNVMTVQGVRVDSVRAAFEGSILAIFDFFETSVLTVQSSWDDPAHRALTIEVLWTLAANDTIH
ncbi:MAG: hypothetical protein Q8Q09_03160 [Deltaproteobacteria bacterium]|nr:hypothetical protein [Deltaproteobacteria bacterium]